jgi:hypothetical protein
MAAKKPSTFSPPPDWDVFKRQPALVLGFHGCDQKIGEAVLAGRQHLQKSTNPYDWLGSGIYFWEADPWRALEFAKQAKEKGFLTSKPITKPYVIGAIIDLGVCCNLLEIDAIQEVRRSHENLVQAFRVANLPLPQNDRGRRNLDRAVIENMHKLREIGIQADQGGSVSLERYETVRAAFMEGGALYDGAGFNSKNHIQISVREHKCIKGYFRLPGL